MEASSRQAPIPDPDADLVAAAQRDPVEFVALYDRYFARVHGYVRRHVADRDEAEDLTSQIFLTALARIGDFSGRGTFAGWLFRITRHTLLNAQRRPAADPQHGEILASCPADAPNPEEQTLRRERAAEVRATLGALGEEQRRLLVLRFWQERSAPEIGAALGARAGTIRVRLHRALRDLRGRLPDEA